MARRRPAAPRETEEEVAEKIAEGRARLQFDQQVLRYFAEGRTAEETARVMECAVEDIDGVLFWYQLKSGRQWKRDGIRTGRIDSRKAIERLRPKKVPRAR